MFPQVMIGREELALPWRFYGMELMRYGGVMLQLKSNQGYMLTFTPQSNEFTVTFQSSATSAQTAGLCGNSSLKTTRGVFMSLFSLILSTLSSQVLVERTKPTFFLCVTAAQLPTSLRSSQTGLWLETGVVFVCQSGSLFVCLEQRWGVRPSTLRCFCPVTPSFLSKCSSPSVRSRHVRSPTRAR